MDFATAVKTVFGKYATFSGRARRSEYWWWVLFIVVVTIVLGIIEVGVLGLAEFQPISGLFSLATIIPSIAVAARRLHDLDKSGWWQLIAFIPLIGWIILIYWYVQPGMRGPNRFGEDPMGA
jgi:uncharacterized membrane protein YhaH (DUF805 family)